MRTKYSCSACTLTPLGKAHSSFVGLAYYQGKDIVFGFIIENSSLRDFGPSVINNNILKEESNFP
jgi:hypothetical protein